MTERTVVRPLHERQWEEFDEARRRAVRDGEAVEPTPDEARNGWDADTLTAYLRERLAMQSVYIDPASLARRVKPSRQNMRYSPFRWRG